MTIATISATERLRRFRSHHRIEVDKSAEWDRCDTCSVRVYQVLTRRWQHDMNEVTRLQAEAAREALVRDPLVHVAEPCFWCKRFDRILDGLYVRMSLPDGEVVNVCDVCFERGQDDGGDDDGPYNTAAGHEHWGDE